MHLKSLHAVAFKRFTDLTVDGLSPTARLIVLAGPNGSGKSSFFDALKMWHWYNGSPSNSYDPTYHQKIGEELPPQGWLGGAIIELDQAVATMNPEDKKKLVYIRSAHRNEADFLLQGLSQLPPPLDSPRVQRSIDNDASVSQNYQRLILSTLGAVFDESLDQSTPRSQIRDEFIGTIRESLSRVFPELILLGVSNDPLTGGTFRFRKGKSNNFPYKNLSAGEKAAFDLLLDLAVSGKVYDQTIWCIDEPETHLNVRVQAALLDELLNLLPAECQLILASHSLGFMRRAWELAQKDADSVQFLDFQDQDFDQPVHLQPTAATREFWNRTLDVAMGDLAALVAPEQVVLCEGRPVSAKGRATKSEFDAKCYRTIFASELPNTDFISIGNSDQVKDDKLELGRSIQALSSGTKVIRLVDRDLLTEDEVAEQKAAGVQVLSRRHIESYLLDDEIIDAFASTYGDGSTAQELKDEKAKLLAASIARGNDTDDLKSITGEWQTFARKRLTIPNSGSNWEAFATKFVAPLITPSTSTYLQLKDDIFDPS